MTTPVKIAVSGGAGQIAYALLFRIASGALLGAKQSVSLSLLETPQALPALDGVEMELRDCAFPTLPTLPALAAVSKTDNPETAFADADIVFLVGAKPRGPGMERKDLLQANADIFSKQGKALNSAAKPSAKILVVGNPANTNCLIARANAPALPDSAFAAMTRLDHNRAAHQLAQKSENDIAQVRRVVIWGNHSATQYPDIHHATIAGKPALRAVGEEWYKSEMIPAVQQRGAAVIKARGASSAASAASAALDHMRDWVCGQNDPDEFTSMALVSGGEYEIESGLVFSYPAKCGGGGKAEVVGGLEMNEFSAEKIRATESELREERDAVRHLLP